MKLIKHAFELVAHWVTVFLDEALIVLSFSVFQEPTKCSELCVSKLNIHLLFKVLEGQFFISNTVLVHACKVMSIKIVSLVQLVFVDLGKSRASQLTNIKKIAS